ncbi:neuraminidase-like domain-containing protein [Actinospica robiniae]|uniref:Tc toxin subunit A-related protein n=1 Tax=Actinospica robiniae TaxID=304901 RepID=UPI00041FCABE|nr:neuraminidase-like domain-containing protein [Actinospica robiniae]
MPSVIRGVVRDRGGRPVGGQRVAVLGWDAESAVSTPLAQGFADPQGVYELEFEMPADEVFVVGCAVGAEGQVLAFSAALSELPEDGSADIVVERRERPGESDEPEASEPEPSEQEAEPFSEVEETGSWNESLAASLIGAPPLPDPDDDYSVSGALTWPDGQPAAHVAIRAYDTDLRGGQPLGPHAPQFASETRTDVRGDYRIVYTRHQFARADLGTADIVVRALDGDSKPCVSSPVHFNAPRHLVVDLVLPAAVAGLPAEYERVVDRVGRLLDQPPPAGLAQLSAENTAFLVGETTYAADVIGALITAIGLAATPAAAADKPAQLTAAYYSLIRVGDPGTFEGLSALSAAQLAADLRKAVAEGIAPVALRDAADACARAIAALAADARGRQLSQGAELSQPAVRYQQTSAASNALVDTRLDAALRAAVLRVIGPASPALATAFNGPLNELGWRASASASVNDLAATVLTQARTTDPATIAEVVTIGKRVASQPPASVSQVLHLNDTVRDNPVLRADVLAATTAGLADLAALPAGASSALTAAAAGLADAPDVTLASLVADRSLTADQAQSFKALLSLSDLTDANIPLLKALQQQGSATPLVLAGWSTDQWTRLLAANSIATPPGSTAEQYAATVQLSLELAYPTQALAARLASGGDDVATFFANNPAVDLRTVSLVTGDVSGLNWQGISDSGHPRVLTQLGSYQRLLALADTTDTRVTLARNGFDSAQAVTALTPEAFARASGLDAGTAQFTYARAQNLALQVAHLYGTANDLLTGPYMKIPVNNNAGPELLDDLLKIDGLAQLFGSQDYCDCGDCQSVLSPAAYFVDLMHFTDQHVSEPVFVTPGLTNHPLYLKNRRGDLWTLPLTCDNTNTLIPYLQIVDEVLEAALTKLLGSDPYQVLSDPTNKATCQVPFTLPFAELGLYLGYFGMTPAQVYQALQSPTVTVHRAAAGLSPDDATVVETNDPTGVVTRLGLASAADLANLPVQSFLRRTGISRDQLTSLIALRCDSGLANVTVVKQPVSGEIQNFPELLQNLTAARADTAFRFLRLYAPLAAAPFSWAVTDLDLVLLTAQTAGLLSGQAALDAATVDLVGRLVAVQQSAAKASASGTGTSLGVSQLCALIGDMPVSAAFPLQPAHAADRLLYEQVFGLADIFGIKDSSTGELNQTADYYHYSLDTTLGSGTPVIDPKTPLLLAGLGISETDLLLLFDLVKADLPFTANGHCTLDRGKLSLLYRQVLVGRMLGLGVADLIAALGLVQGAAAVPVSTLDQVEAMQAFGSWLGAATAFTVGQLQLIISGVESPTVKFATTPQTVAALVQRVQAAAPPTGPAPDPVVTLKTELCGAFTVGAGRLADVLTWTDEDVAIITVPIQDALAATFTNGIPDNPALLQPLTDLVRRLERDVLLFAQLQLPDAEVDYLTANAAQLGITDRSALKLADVQAVAAYTGYVGRVLSPSASASSLATATATGSGADASALSQAVLTSYAGAGSFSTDDRARLADLLAVDQSLIASVLTAATLPSVAIAALERVDQLATLCKTLGVNAYSLFKLGVDTDYAALAAAAQVAYGAIGAQYTDESARDTALEPYQDRLNSLKRDALCGYLIDGRPELHFTGHDDLYDYFLLDVDTSGCTRTSRVVAAISSVQLYIQRCVTGLEQSDPAITSITAIRVDPSAIPAVEWSWRQNFRVWQANREVFLYPESYMDPGLRDDKTPAFEDLENALMQQQITDATAGDAYSGYLTDLADLAHLRICGSFHDAPSNTYYFFGRTQQDPPSFYYRSWDTTTWTAWVSVDLPIDGPYVAAAMHLGRLMVFWADGTVKDHTTISGGSSSTDYYQVQVKLVYSLLEPDGTWREPQKLDWLYPSPEETISAVDEVFEGYYSSPEENIAAMELSKTYEKSYPWLVGKGVVLRYYNATLSPYYFDRGLDLFHNRLVTGSGIPDLGQGTALGIYFTGSTAYLGIETRDYGTEADFDLAREQATIIATPHTIVTTGYPYENREATDPGRRYFMHAVHRGFPESVVQIGDQQFLVHEAGYRLLNPGRLHDTAALNIHDAAIARDDAEVQAHSMFLGPSLDMHAIRVPDPILFTPIRAPRGLVRLSTSVADYLGETNAESGLDQLLDLATQTNAVEQPLPFKITAPAQLSGPADDPHHIDLHGAFGAYFKELYLHIPWLIAQQLNTAGQYADALKWFRHVFDPTAAASASDATPADRNWRYVGFRGLTVPTLQQQLTDPAALAAYRDDPFNPFAIGRLRPSAFQKAIVMQFIGNLLDWGDSLFAQDTTESINEATMLYVLADEILGPRPVSLGECEVLDESKLTYAAIAPSLGSASDFLVTLENWIYQFQWTASPELLTYAKALNVAKQWDDIPSQWVNQAIPIYHAPQLVAQSTLVFCVPPNSNLLALWDRVDDRLYKIRNCMNISGVRRQLALFAPPINPMDLVRAQAAGMSIEQATAGLAAPVPAYRFSYLLERARQAAQSVATFASALLSALERKDAEELTLLESLHQRTILQMTTDVRNAQVQEAQFLAQAALGAQANAQNRADYYQGLIQGGLSGWEQLEEDSRKAAAAIRGVESAVHLMAAITYLVPQIGSPFAMKYGGQELGHSGVEFAEWSSTMASILEVVASAAQMEASFDRRSQEWQQQLTLAQQDVASTSQQAQAAQQKADYAQRELDIHRTSIDQASDLDAFYKGKFTGLGLFTYLARTLTTLHRQAYDAAYQLAQAAQVAYKYELDDDTLFVAPDNWSGDKAGLLSAERLLVQLQQMENAYLAGNTRRYEMTQHFALSIVDPGALNTLRETGSCAFDLPELLFDVVYPGHYKRLVKSVRVTLPGVTGPYVNVGAKLTMTASKVRATPSTGPSGLVAVPSQPKIASAIATSTGVSDAGVFELSFRDERYLPFEGAGAVSSWQLDLPAKLRSFDYRTISDVVVHLSYTALDDGAFRDTVENGIVSELTQFAATTGLSRLISLRHDFPGVYNQLTGGTAAANTSSSFPFTDRQVPYFLTGRTLAFTSAQALLVPQAAGPVVPGALTVSLNGATGSAWTAVAGTPLMSSTLPVSGPLLGTWTFATPTGHLDPTQVADVLLLVGYKAS